MFLKKKDVKAQKRLSNIIAFNMKTDGHSFRPEKTENLFQ